MADFLAITWEKTGLFGVEAQVGGSSVTVNRSFHVEWPEQFNPVQDPISAGSWLKNEFTRLSISGKNVLISFPRHESTIRLLEIPDVPLDEVPEIVQFQAATKSSVPLNQLMLDFLLLPARVDKTNREVLVASISKELHEQAVKTIQSTGLDVISTGISSISAVEWIAHTDSGNMAAPTVIANHVDHHLEMSLVRDQELLFTNSTSITSKDQNATEQSILTELNRFLLVCGSQLDGHKTERIFLIGDQQKQEELTEQIVARFQCAVEVLDPLTNMKSASGDYAALPFPGVLAGPIGLLHSQLQKKMETIDFLNPHKAEVKPDRRKLQLGLGVAGIVVILLAALFMTQSRVTDLDEQIAERQKIRQDLDDFLKRGQPTLESVALIEKWENTNSQAINLIEKLEKVLPGTDRLYLSELDLTRSAGQSISRLKASGHAKDELDVRDINQQLSNNNFRIHPRKSNNSTIDTNYPIPFEIDAERLPPPTTVKPKSTTAKR